MKRIKRDQMGRIMETRPMGMEDVQLKAEYGKIRRFRIKRKDLRAGLVLNVRDAQAMDNIMVEIYDLTGKSYKLVREHHSAMSFNINKQVGSHYDNYIYVDTLAGYNHAYKYNSKTIAFFEKLKKASRFQQYCLLSGHSFTEDTYNLYILELYNDSRFDQEIQEMIDSYRYIDDEPEFLDNN